MAPPKVILQLYPMIPAADEEDRKRRRPMGRDRDLYHRALHDWPDIIRAAEELGVWGASTIEHHLHSEEAVNSINIVLRRHSTEYLTFFFD